MKNNSRLTAATSDRTIFRSRRSSTIFAAATIGLALLNASYAADTTVPWECSNYSGDAQTRCMQGLIEAQRDKIGKLEGEVQSQRSQMGTLQEQLDRQSRATADLQRQLDRPSTVVPAPSPYPYAYPYAYAYPYPYVYTPGIRFGLYFGSPGLYGGPYFYGPGYWGYRHWGHR